METTSTINTATGAQVITVTVTDLGNGYEKYALKVNGQGVQAGVVPTGKTGAQVKKFIRRYFTLA